MIFFSRTLIFQNTSQWLLMFLVIQPGKRKSFIEYCSSTLVVWLLYSGTKRLGHLCFVTFLQQNFNYCIFMGFSFIFSICATHWLINLMLRNVKLAIRALIIDSGKKQFSTSPLKKPTSTNNGFVLQIELIGNLRSTCPSWASFWRTFHQSHSKM